MLFRSDLFEPLLRLRVSLVDIGVELTRELPVRGFDIPVAGVSCHPEDPVVILAHRHPREGRLFARRNTHHRGTQEFVAKEVATLQLRDDLPLGHVGAHLTRDRLVDGGVEGVTFGVN